VISTGFGIGGRLAPGALAELQYIGLRRSNNALAV
jgi:hypothetical protein